MGNDFVELKPPAKGFTARADSASSRHADLELAIQWASSLSKQAAQFCFEQLERWSRGGHVVDQRLAAVLVERIASGHDAEYWNGERRCKDTPPSSQQSNAEVPVEPDAPNAEEIPF